MQYVVKVSELKEYGVKHEGELLRKVRTITRGILACESISEAQALADHIQTFYRKGNDEVRSEACGVLYLDKGKATLSIDRLQDLHAELTEAFVEQGVIKAR